MCKVRMQELLRGGCVPPFNTWVLALFGGLAYEECYVDQDVLVHWIGYGSCEATAKRHPIEPIFAVAPWRAG